MSELNESHSTFQWLQGVIDSCKHRFHLECVDRLIELYYEKHRDEQLCDELKLMRQAKYDEIHSLLM
jgi:hypothetical protein